MSTITIAGSACIIKAGFALEDLKLLTKYAPDKLETRDDKGNLIFKAAMAAQGQGDVAPKAIYFAPVTHDPDGLATVTFGIPNSVEDVKEWAADEFGAAYTQLNALEDQIQTATLTVLSDRAALMDSINVQ